MSTVQWWEGLDSCALDGLELALGGKRRRGRSSRRAGRLRRALRWLTETLAAPIVVAGASGAVRGEPFDQWLAGQIQAAIVPLETWLAEHLFREWTAWAISRSLPFALLGTGILVLSGSLLGIRNYLPCIVVSEIARRQGRSTSAVDLLIACSLPISMTIAVTFYEAASVMAVIFFALAFLFCRLSFHAGRVRGFLNWVVRLRGPMGGIEPDHDDDHDYHEEHDT